MVMDLGFKSNLNLHRAHGGPFRVRIEARQAVGGAGETSGKLIESSTYWFVTSSESEDA